MSETAVDIILRSLTAVALGSLIGLERELRDHPAGIRTHILVTLGACLFTAMSLFGFPGSPGGDRVAAAVVTGIGFIGAGAILKSERGFITGVTTAASLWACAAVGMIAGTGEYTVAAVVTLIILLVLTLIDWVTDALAARFRVRRMILSLTGHYSEEITGRVVDILEKDGVRVEIAGYARSDEGGILEVRMRTRVPRQEDVAALTESVYAVQGVTGVAWE